MRPADPRKGRWSTPDWLFQPLNTLLRFELDAAADKENTKCRKYLSQGKRSGLVYPWDAESVWCNPPYGQQPGTDVWVELGRSWAARLRNRITMLIPVKADTAWYDELCWGRNDVVASARIRAPEYKGRSIRGRWYRLREDFGYVELLELRGRVDFGGASGPGFFASAVVLFNAGRRPVLPQLELLPSHRLFSKVA